MDKLLEELEKLETLRTQKEDGKVEKEEVPGESDDVVAKSVKPIEDPIAQDDKIRLCYLYRSIIKKLRVQLDSTSQEVEYWKEQSQQIVDVSKREVNISQGNEFEALARIQQLQQELKQENDLVKMRNSEINKLKATINSLARENEVAKQQELSRVNELLKKQEIEIEKLNNTISNVSRENTNVKAELTELKVQYRNSCGLSCKLLETIKVLKSKYEKIKIEHEATAGNLAKQVSGFDQLLSSKESLQRERKDIERDIENEFNSLLSQGFRKNG